MGKGSVSRKVTIQMEILLRASCPFNLDVTLCCGQTFRWNKKNEWWYGVVGQSVFQIRQVGNRLEFENAESSFVRHYFGLDDNLQKIYSQIGKDRHIKRAIMASKGLRILRQDPWECLISYICATYKNIKSIEQMLFNLSRKFGEKISFDEHEFFAFPTPDKLAYATAKELTDCGLGYRAKYVHETARMVYEGRFEPESLKKSIYQKAKEELLNFPGVGLKVADCILLFSFAKLEAFPVDVWIRHAILKHYARHFRPEFVQKLSEEKSLTNSEYEKLNLFGREHFGEYAGYSQEYLYHYERRQAQG